MNAPIDADEEMKRYERHQAIRKHAAEWQRGEEDARLLAWSECKEPEDYRLFALLLDELP